MAERMNLMDEIQEIVKEKKIPYYNDLAERANYDREAFSELYDHFFPRVYNWLFGKMMDRDAADDVVSVTFEKMMLNLSAYDKRKAAKRCSGYLSFLKFSRCKYH